MPFTFKLSKRLALMKASLAAAAVALAACEQQHQITDLTSPSSSVVQVVIVPDSVTLDPRQTQQFAAYGRTQAGDSVAVAASWSGLGGTITSGGLYTADTIAGTYHVTATAPAAAVSTTLSATSTSLSATSTTLSGSSVVKNRGQLKQIIVMPTAASVLAGGTVQFAAYGRRANGDSVAVSVTYSATGGAIAAAGLYTAGQSTGTYGVVATQSGGTLAGTATVTVGSVPVASVTVSPAAASLTVGGTRQFTAVTKDSAGNTLTGRVVTWVSSNTGDATVSSTGMVTGKAAGSVTITATSETKSVTAGVTVTNTPVASVTVSPASASFLVGATQQFTAVTKDSAGNTLTGRTVTWASSNTTVAAVSSSGVVTGNAAGTATITATSEGQIGTATVTVTAASCVTSAGAWQNGAMPSQTGAFEAQFDATPNTANMDGVMGLSSGPAADYTTLAAIVLFSSTGTIQARNGGAYAAATTIPYSAGTTYHFRLDVDVSSHSYTVYVTPTGSTEQLLGSNFAFRTEQATVSALDNLGLKAAVGSVAVCSLAVSGWTPPPPTPVASVTVSPAVAMLTVGQNVQLTASLKDANGSPTSGALTWASGNAALATVSASGLVTGLALGSATITATSGGQTGSAAVTVNLVTDPSPVYTLGTGANYYVAPSGSDANPCTAAAPCYTMQRVSQLMSPGDNAHFAAGNYTWSYSSNKATKSGTASAPITYISDVKWGAKVYGNGCDPIWNSGDYVQIINFDLTGNCSEGINVDGNYDKVIGNRVHDLPACTSGWCVAGIMSYSDNFQATGVQVIGNVVDNIAMNTTDPVQQNTIHGIYMSGPNAVVQNNIVTRAIAACIELYHNTTNEIVTNNTVANCGRYGIEIGADPSIGVNRNSIVNNNIVVNVNGRGFHETNSVGDVFYNNVIYNNNPNWDICCGVQSGTITLTSARFNALFVNYTGDMTGDYHLQAGAAAIDAGTTLCVAGVGVCVPAFDFAGTGRPNGAAYDIGAYEY